MLESIPSQSAMEELLGRDLFGVWRELCAAIDERYDMERVWNTGGKNWTYEYKYRRGGKTLCCLYAKSACIGLMVSASHLLEDLLADDSTADREREKEADA